MKLIDRIKYQINIERATYNIIRSHMCELDREKSEKYFLRASEISEKTKPIAKRLGEPYKKSLEFL